MATKNYTLGRGELHFAQFKPGTQNPKGERYFGNTPEFNLNAEIDTLDHYSADRGIKERDDQITLQVNYSGSLTTDNISAENVALFFFGEVSTVSQASETATIENFTDVEKGLTYQLGMDAASPSGVRKVSSVVVKNGAGTTTYVAGTDYTVDLDLGRVEVLTTGTISTTMQVTYNVAATTFERVISGNEAIEGALRFIAYNAAGEQHDFYMPRVKLQPNGDYALKGDDWQQIPLMVEVLKKPGYEAVYRDGRPLS